MTTHIYDADKNHSLCGRAGRSSAFTDQPHKADCLNCLRASNRVKTEEPADYIPEPMTAGYTAEEREAIDRALEIVERHMQHGEALTSPAASRDFLRLRLADKPYEVFSCLFLDNRHHVIEYQEMFRGTIDGASVHAREVVREALKCNAAAIIFAHNHPSGISEPSGADRAITRRLREALALIDVRVLDHFVIGCGEVTSFAERGLI